MRFCCDRVRQSQSLRHSSTIKKIIGKRVQLSQKISVVRLPNLMGPFVSSSYRIVNDGQEQISISRPSINIEQIPVAFFATTILEIVIPTRQSSRIV
jgi:hypothetical protein